MPESRDVSSPSTETVERPGQGDRPELVQVRRLLRRLERSQRRRQPRQPAQPPSLEPTFLLSSGVELRLLRSDDLEGVQAVVGRADVMRQYVDLTDRSQGWPLAMTAQFIDDSSKSWQTKGYGFWAIVDSERVVGVCGLQDLTWIPGKTGAVEFDFWLHPSAQGRGIGLECAAALIAWGLYDRGLRHIVAAAVIDNAASRKVLRHVGRVEDAHVDYVSASGDRAVFVVNRVPTPSFIYRVPLTEKSAFTRVVTAPPGAVTRRGP